MTRVSSSARVVLGNALANVLRGGIAALVALALPPILTRSLPVSTFGAWGLILQLAAYVGLLDFGLQMAVSRFVAHCNELGDRGQRDSIVSTAFAALSGLGAVGFAAMLVLAWQLPRMFSQMPASLYSGARTALLLVGASLALSLPFGVFNSIFIGLQRNEVPAAIVVAGKVIGGGLVVVAARLGGGLFWMAVGMAAANVATALAQYWACRRVAAEIRVSSSALSRGAGRELFGYCFSLSVWSVAMLLVSGLSTAIVGVFDFKSVAYFTVAVSLTNFLAGIQSAAFSAIMPVAAALGARRDARQLGEVLISSTRYGMLILLLGGLPLIICSFWILRLWVGAGYALHAQAFLQVLVAANIVRLSATPYCALLIGTGQQRLVILTPLVEGAANLFSSILLASALGPVGVAWGTLVGAVVGVTCNYVYNMHRTKGISFSPARYFVSGILRPLGAALPVVPLSLGILLFRSSGLLAAAVTLPSGALLLYMLWRFAADPEERRRVLRFLLRKPFTVVRAAARVAD
ncbi:MAG: polysaccharide biosynthesis C-terminal domain-containing protein [Limisphaerales bacterium]